jgi:hypothetical protein
VRKIICITLLLWLTPQLLRSQTIATDRPGFTDAVTAVDKGTLQIESGFLRSFGVIPDGSWENISWNNTSLRYGIFQNTELRVFANISQVNLNHPRIDYARQDGLNPVKAGFKTELVEGYNQKPSISVIGHLNIPTDSGRILPDMHLVFHHQVDPKLSINYMLGLNWLQPDLTTLQWTFKLQQSINEHWAFYGELYGSRNPEVNQQSMDGGLSFMANENLQFDLFGGLGMNREAPDWLVGFGFGWRLKNFMTREQ